MSEFKVGDKVKRVEYLNERIGRFYAGEEFAVVDVREGFVVDPSGLTHDPKYLASVSTISPVRQRTITEIVPGTYGRIRVMPDHGVKGDVGFVVLGRGLLDAAGSPAFNASELRAASVLFLSLAEALESME